ncbi:MAG: amidohydrolase family protein [Sphingobium sp.]
MSNSDVLEARRGDSKPFDEIGLFASRKPQKHSVEGAIIISADNHVGLGGEDVFYKDAPEHLKDRVPRIYFNEERGYWTSSFNGKPVYPPGTEAVIDSVESRDGVWNIDTRMADMDAEGVDIEIAFPQVLPLTLFRLPDYEAREYIMAQYNRNLAKLQTKAPGRFYGVGIPNYWDGAKARESVKEIHDLGIKVLMLPCLPGKYEDGRDIRYADEDLRPLWAAIEEFDITASFHIGENAGFAGRGAFPAAILNNLLGPDFRQLWAQLVFGGIFDEFPGLRVVFAEANLHWVPGMLQDADMIPESFAGLIDYVPKMRPSEYWYRHCFATFTHDPAGLSMLDRVGRENALWSVDYPHNEGTFGYTGSVVDSIVEQVGAETARLVCGENARKCFKI